MCCYGAHGSTDIIGALFGCGRSIATGFPYLPNCRESLPQFVDSAL